MGLYDRDYMRGSNRPEGGKESFLSTPSGMLWTLIGVNVILYFLCPPGSNAQFQWVLTPDTFQTFEIYRLVTAGFMHGSFSHILFNMWGLYLFGTMVAPHLGGYRFLALYLCGILTGNVLFFLFGAGFLLGASGAVCAVMAAAAMLEPERRFVMLFLPTAPIKTTTLVIVYTILEIASEIFGLDASISHIAHLGGFIGGYLCMRRMFRGQTLPWDPFRKKNTASGHWQFFNRSPEEMPKDARSASRVSPQELDALLDKISREGINSLSEYELSRLRQARKEMRGEE